MVDDFEDTRNVSQRERAKAVDYFSHKKRSWSLFPNKGRLTVMSVNCLLCTGATSYALISNRVKIIGRIIHSGGGRRYIFILCSFVGPWGRKN